MSQLEFIDISRDKSRPPGSGQVIGGLFVYHAIAQRVDQVAYTLDCTVRHIHHLIHEGELPNAVDISCDTSKRACYRVPRQDVLDFIESRKEGC